MQGRRPEAVYFNGCQWRRGFTNLNTFFGGKQLIYYSVSAKLCMFGNTN